MVNKNIISWLERHNEDVKLILKENKRLREENKELKEEIKDILNKYQTLKEKLDSSIRKGEQDERRNKRY